MSKCAEEKDVYLKTAMYTLVCTNVRYSVSYIISEAVTNVRQ